MAKLESELAITDKREIVASCRISSGSSKNEIKKGILSAEKMVLENTTECEARIFIKLMALTLGYLVWVLPSQLNRFHGELEGVSGTQLFQ